MIIFVWFFLLAALITLLISLTESEYRKFAVLGILGVLVLIGLSASSVFCADRVSNVTEQNIISIHNDTISEGTFFLGCGSIEGKEYYYYFVVNDNGSKQLKKALNHNVFIYEDAQNKVVHIKEHYNVPWWWVMEIGEKNITEFHIPSNSIVRDFNLR